MCLIRETALLLAAATLAVTGCSRQRPPQSSPVNGPPVADQATQKRDWSPSVAQYSSGAVQGFPLRETIQVSRKGPLHAVREPTAFLANAAVMPFTLITTPLFAQRIYYGDEVPPSYTAVPPLPPEPGR